MASYYQYNKSPVLLYNIGGYEEPIVKLIKIISIFALIGSFAWLITDPGFEPALTLLGAISAIITYYFLQNKNKKNKSQNIHQRQSISKSSTGIQAGGDVRIVINEKENNDKK